MSVFFAGQLLISPATVSVVDDSAMVNRNLSVGNVLALIGRSEGGKPNTVLRFGRPSEARAVLRGGELLDAVERAFDPSPETGAPATVVAIRVNPATQSTLALKDAGAADVITLKSTDYGLYTSLISIKIESGTTAGKKVTTQFGESFYTEDNIERGPFSVQYTGGEATGVMSITNTTLTLEAPAATVVATIDLTAFSTVQQLVDRINAVTDFTAAVLDGHGAKPTLNGLDAVTNQDVKTAAYTVRADLQAVVDWINSTGEGYITATRAPAGNLPPVNIPVTYLVGGSDGVVTNTEWSNAFTVLQSADVQWVVPLTSDTSVHAMADAHAAFMSGVGRMERRALVGGAVGQTQSEAIAAAKALNSDRISQVYPGHYNFDRNGNRTLYPSYMTAALVAAAFSGSNPGTALTNKAIKVRGLELQLRNPTDTDQLLLGGVMPVEETATGFKVVQSITTWLVNDNYNRVEVSTGFAVDFTARNVRNAVDVMRGKKGNPQTLAEAKSVVDSTLALLARPEPSGPGVLAGDDESPAYRNIEVTLEGDVMRIEFQCSPVIPVNYIPVTIHAVPFAGSAA